MASNFDFLQTRFPTLFDYASHAKSLVYTAARASYFYARFTLEQGVYWLYVNDAYLQPPYDNNLSALIHEQTFKDNLNPPPPLLKSPHHPQSRQHRRLRLHRHH